MKLPSTEDLRNKEMGDTESQKDQDMLKLIMDQNAQIRNMEAELEKLVKEKEHNAQLALVPLEAIPITTIPQTRVVSSTTRGGSTSTTTPAKDLDVVGKLTKAMEGMSI